MPPRSRILAGGGAALGALLLGSAWYSVPHVHNDLTQEALRHIAVELGAAPDYEGQPHDKQSVLASLAPYGITNLTMSGHRATITGSPRTDAEIDALRAAAVRWGVADVRYEVDPTAVANLGGGALASLSNGVLTLRGTVASEVQRRSLVGAAERVYGASNVIDRLTVDAGSGGAVTGATGAGGARLSDAQVDAFAAMITAAGKATTLDGSVGPTTLRFRATVADAATKAAVDGLAARAASSAGLRVDNQVTAVAIAQNVAVSLAGGKVTLQGTVGSEAQRQALVAAAQRAYGAANVIDKLTVATGPAGAGSLTDVQVGALASLLAGAPNAVSLDASLTPEALRFRAGVAAGAATAVDTDATRAAAAAGLRIDAAITAAPSAGPTFTAAPTTAAPTTTAAAAPTTTGAPTPTTTAPTANSGGTPEQQVTSLQRELDALAAVQQQTVFFASGSSQLTPEAMATLAKVADAMARYPSPTVDVGGHTDSDGDDEANRQLSEARAGAVRDALVGMGVAPARLSAIGYGETVPRADNATPEGRAQNRRVEFVVKKGS